MAFDLLTRKRTPRDWSRETSLVTLPTLPNLAKMTPAIVELATKAKDADDAFQVRPSGRGITATVTRKWG